MTHPTSHARSRGFSLVELLVVIAIIAVLISLLFTLRAHIRERGDMVICTGNLRQIGLAVRSYLSDNDGVMYPYRNWGRWLDPANKTTMINPAHADAYWGVVFALHAGKEKKLWHCPRAQDTDPARSDGLHSDGHIYRTYALNGFGQYLGTGTASDDAIRNRIFGAPNLASYYQRTANNVWVGRATGSIRHPDSMLLAQDAYEAVTDGNGDTLDKWYQWPTRKEEYFRHREKSNLLFLDGNVSSSTGENWVYHWYTGDGKWNGER